MLASLSRAMQVRAALAALWLAGCGGLTTSAPPAPDSTAADDANAAGDANASADGAPGEAAGDDAGVFAGADAFAPGASPRPSTVNIHRSVGIPTATGTDCMASACHGSGGDGPILSFGGTVYTDATGTAPAVGVEIRVIDSKGLAASAFSDSDGNFYARQPAFAAPPGHAGARDGSGVLDQASPVTSWSCNSAACHGAGKRIYAP